MGSVLTPIDLFMIVASILLVVAVGLWASRKQGKSADDYFLASGRLPWWMIGSAFVSTSVSSEQIVGTVGQAYQSGMGVANSEWWSLPPYIILIAVFIPIYLKNKITTVPDLLTRRFDPLCGQIYSWVMLLAYIVVFLPPVLYGGSITFAQLTGFDEKTVLVVMTALVLLYTVKGGLFSVMWTDALQCAMLLGGGLILYYVALAKIPGGWSAMAAANADRFHLYRPATDPIAPFLGYVISTFGLMIFYQAGNQVMVQRVFGARSTWDGMMGIIFAGLINMFRPLVTCFLGFIVYHWVNVMKQAPPIPDNKIDTVFPFALDHFGGTWGLRGIVLAGFLAAVMSTLSSLANSTSTIFSLEIYRRYINPQASDKILVRVGRWATLISMVIAMFLTGKVQGTGLFKYFQQGVTMVSTPFATTLLVGIFWKRANRQSAYFGLIGGIVIQLICSLIIGPQISAVVAAKYHFDPIAYSIHWFYPAAIAEVLTLIGMVIVALATPPPAESEWKSFLWSPRLLSEVTTGERPWYASLKLWFIVYAVAWIGAYWWFW